MENKKMPIDSLPERGKTNDFSWKMPIEDKSLKVIYRVTPSEIVLNSNAFQDGDAVGVKDPVTQDLKPLYLIITTAEVYTDSSIKIGWLYHIIFLNPDGQNLPTVGMELYKCYSVKK